MSKTTYKFKHILLKNIDYVVLSTKPYTSRSTSRSASFATSIRDLGV